MADAFGNVLVAMMLVAAAAGLAVLVCSVTMPFLPRASKDPIWDRELQRDAERAQRDHPADS